MNDESDEELSPRSFFGEYVIEALIGRGAMARVYAARNRVTRARVALKVLDRWVHDHRAGKERFLREARVAAAIKHPNVVNILDVGVWRERRFIVMELLEGHDLDQHLSQAGPLPSEEVVKIALPVISGMLAVHEAGVVHRDLKPSNIFLCRDAAGRLTPKVLDFGISKFSSSLEDPVASPTRTRDVIGTPTNMAPEALNGVRELGPKADQYSLGTVLYECAVGRPPFEGETLLELLKEVALGKIALPRSIRPEIPVELEVAILRSLHTTPAARFESLRELGRALWPLADSETRLIWDEEFGAEQEPVTLVTVPKALSRAPIPPPPRIVEAHPQPTSRRLRTLLLVATSSSGVLLLVMCMGTSSEQKESVRQRSEPQSAPVQEQRLAAQPALLAPAPDELGVDEAESNAKAEAKAQSVQPRPKVTRSRRPRRHAPRATPPAASSAANSSVPSSKAPAPSEAPVTPSDPDLADFFELSSIPEAPPQRTAATAPDELADAFGSPREDSVSIGVNGSPLLD